MTGTAHTPDPDETLDLPARLRRRRAVHADHQRAVRLLRVTGAIVCLLVGTILLAPYATDPAILVGAAALLTGTVLTRNLGDRS
jgi:hypothetical protein